MFAPPALNVTDDRPRIGLLAGWGRFPITVAKALKEQGYYVSCLAVVDHADPVLKDICDDFSWQGLAKLGRAIRYFRRRGIYDATMAGKIHKVVLYQPWIWFRHLPDWRAIQTFYPHFVASEKDRKDDTLLGAVVEAFAQDGIRFGPATDYAPELLVNEGQLTKEIGRLDVGQSVCVKERAVLAIEAIEGTDECIRRAGELCRKGGFTIVKVAKPQQDMRFDVPTIGLWTLEVMVASGAKILAVEAGRTILIDEPEFLEFANRHKLIVVALPEAKMRTAAA